MEMKLFSLLFCLCFSLLISLSTSLLPVGIHPLDENYYSSDVIKCKDGSNSFTRDRVNDDFCDCADGTDEPGTAACSNGKFYCKNLGSTPQFLFSSRVNDHICDCCDGSDEYASGAICPNTCVMGGNFAYKRIGYGSVNDLDFSGMNVAEKSVVAEDSNQKLSGLKIAIIVQALFLSLVVAFWLFYRLFRLRRRHYR